MKKIIGLLFLFSCGNPSSRQEPQVPSTVDSQVLRQPADGSPQIDTDDHNKPSQETIALDSPTGPNPGWDTVLQRPVPGAPK